MWEPKHGMWVIGEDPRALADADCPRMRGQLVRVDLPSPLPGRGMVKWHVLLNTDPQIVFPFSCDDDLIRSCWRPAVEEASREEPASFEARVDYLAGRLLEVECAVGELDAGVAHTINHLWRDLLKLKRLPVARPWHKRVALNKAQLEALGNWRRVPPGNRRLIALHVGKDPAEGRVYREDLGAAVKLLEALGEPGEQDEPPLE